MKKEYEYNLKQNQDVNFYIEPCWICEYPKTIYKDAINMYWCDHCYDNIYLTDDLADEHI